MDSPTWIARYLEKDSDVRIEAAIVAVERQTSCEVVPMVVRSSSETRYIPGVILCLLLMVYFALDSREFLSNIIGRYEYTLPISLLVLTVLAISLGRIPLVQRLFLSQDEMEQQVRRRAELEFYRAGLHDTRDGIGILIFLSMLERKVVILGDRKISAQLPESTWDDAITQILEHKRRGSLTDGIIAGIKYCGPLLAKHFPIDVNDVNELKNHLIIKE